MYVQLNIYLFTFKYYCGQMIFKMLQLTYAVVLYKYFGKISCWENINSPQFFKNKSTGPPAKSINNFNYKEFQNVEKKNLKAAANMKRKKWKKLLNVNLHCFKLKLWPGTI